MRKFILWSCVALASTTIPFVVAAATPQNVVGRILLQVESRGEAWYVSPVSAQRTYLPDGASAYQLLRNAGLGISNVNSSKIPVGIDDKYQDTDTDGDGLSDSLEAAIGTDSANADTDGDGYPDGLEVRNGYDPLKGGGAKTSTDPVLAKRLAGRILLQVESRGEAWYVNPVDGKRYYMKDGAAAYAVMRDLSLGISNANLETIPAASAPAAATSTTMQTTQQDCGTDTICFSNAVSAGAPATGIIPKTMPLIFIPGTLVFNQKATLTKDGNNWTYDEVLNNAERLGEVHRPILEAAGGTTAEIDTLLATNTRAGMTAAEFPADQIDLFFSPAILDTVVTSALPIHCTQVDRTALGSALAKWAKMEFTYGGSYSSSVTYNTNGATSTSSVGTTTSTLRGDYTFGQCSYGTK